MKPKKCDKKLENQATILACTERTVVPGRVAQIKINISTQSHGIYEANFSESVSSS